MSENRSDGGLTHCAKGHIWETREGDDCPRCRLEAEVEMLTKRAEEAGLLAEDNSWVEVVTGVRWNVSDDMGGMQLQIRTQQIPVDTGIYPAGEWEMLVIPERHLDE